MYKDKFSKVVIIVNGMGLNVASRCYEYRTALGNDEDRSLGFEI